MDQIKNDTPTIIELSNKVSRLTVFGEGYEARIHNLEDRLNLIYETLAKQDAIIEALNGKVARAAVKKLEAKKTFTENQIKKAISKTLNEYSAPVYHPEFISFTLKQLNK